MSYLCPQNTKLLVENEIGKGDFKFLFLGIERK